MSPTIDDHEFVRRCEALVPGLDARAEEGEALRRQYAFLLARLRGKLPEHYSTGRDPAA